MIEYLAEGTYRPQITLVRGRYKYVMCPGDPDQLFDLHNDPDELHNRAADHEYADVLGQMRQALEARYDLAALESGVLASQGSRQLVARALQQGRVQHWDFEPRVEQRYVRGDFWNSLAYGTIPDLTV